VLAGQRRPTAGEVLVAGVDLGDVALEEWRRQVAWLPQRPRLFQGTVADNVRLGDPQASDNDVNEALATAGLLPSMLRADHTLAEGGTGLSAGQRQRVAIARLLLRVRRRDVGLVLLDEPTAHLDGATEAAVLAGLLEAVSDRCVLLVAHRPALLAAADQVVRLAAGSPEIVVDCGAA
jgi:ATP-binding cassette subfamily C protein CydCD